jgi:hypothetical protein
MKPMGFIRLGTLCPGPLPTLPPYYRCYWKIENLWEHPARNPDPVAHGTVVRVRRKG